MSLNIKGHLGNKHTKIISNIMAIGFSMLGLAWLVNDRKIVSSIYSLISTGLTAFGYLSFHDSN